MKNFLKATLIGLLIGTQAYAGLPPTTTKGANDASKVTTFNMAFPGSPVVHSGITAYVPTPPSGGKTYISNGDFESNSTTGWTLCNTTLTGTLPTGTITNTASSFNALSTTSSSPLAGSYSLSVSSAGATTAGQGFCSSTFTIDAEDSTVSPHVQTITASYSGTANMNFSGTSSNTWAAYVYDVTNSQWIQPSGVYNFVGDGKLVATFQPNITSSQYRLALLNVNASSGAIAMLWDSFSVGPQAVQKGPAMSDCVPYTPTFTNLGTVTAVNVCSYRQGDRLVIQGNFTPGTGAAALAQMSLGYNGVSGNVTIDPVKITANQVVGGAFQNVNATTIPTVIGNGGNGFVNFGFQGSSFSGITPQNGNNISSVVTSLVNVSVPISGWSSNSVQSSDTDTRIVDFVGNKNATQSVTATTTDITFIAIKDSHSAWNGSQYVVPVAGDYDVAASLLDNGSLTDTFYAYVNGVQTRTIGVGVSGAFSGGSALLVNLKVGDTISIRTNQTTTIAANTLQHLSISRKSGPAVVTATESVNMRAETPTGTPPSTSTQIVFPTVSFDSHNAYNSSTGTYTVPTSGTYRVSSNICIDGSFSAGTASEIQLMKNSTGFGYYRNDQGGNFTGLCTNASATIKAVQGDTFSVKFYTAATSPAYYSVANTNHGNNLCIERIGN